MYLELVGLKQALQFGQELAASASRAEL
jgi:hypothetical protein